MDAKNDPKVAEMAASIYGAMVAGGGSFKDDEFFHLRDFCMAAARAFYSKNAAQTEPPLHLAAAPKV